MRVAWFSPLPPVRSGIAAYSAELLPLFRETFVIDEYPERLAHDFVWRHRRAPYDLVVYQLGNAPCHDYMWAYLARYPGLVVLHDAKLHHARARQLLQHGRTDDYRREFLYDHPEAPPDVAEYAVAGLSGSIYYIWPMISVVLRTARRVCFHNAIVAADVREAFPDVRVDTVRMGVPERAAAPDARATVRDSLNLPGDACVFAAFGKVTAEKRIGPILNALAQLADAGSSAHLMFVGDADSVVSTLRPELQARGLDRRVRVTGYVPDAAIADYLAAADACLCLRWPTAQETSASWLRCLAAARPTVITDLAHLADIPDTATLRVDLLDEERTLTAAMRSLADNANRREQIGRAGHAFWRANHTLDIMANDYRRLLPAAAADPAPEPDDLPAHFVADHSETANAIAERFQVSIDILRRSPRS
jgi:glycosyltransferase involved in cell wall biosynthesis